MAKICMMKVDARKVPDLLRKKGPRVLAWGVEGGCLSLQLLGTVGAVNLLVLKDERLVGQRHRALLAVEAIIVPGPAFVADHVGAFSKACWVK